MSQVFPYCAFGEDISVYSELPVDIETFIKDDYFIGKFTRNGEMIYPYWHEKLQYMFSTYSKYSEMVNATAIGTGKTRISIICFTYYLYCLMCLKNPNEFFKFVSNDKVQVVIASVGKPYVRQYYEIFIDAILDSPWFRTHGTFIQVNKNNMSEDDISNITYHPFSNIYIEIAYNSDMILGKQLVGFYFGWLCDNYNNRDTAKFYGELKARITSRTTIDKIRYGRCFIDFELGCNRSTLDYWKSCVDSGNADLMLNTGSQWRVKPYYFFNTNRFTIITDEIKGHSKIFDMNYTEDRIIPKGYRVIEVPTDFMSIVELDIDHFMVDIAGIDLKDPTD